MKKYLLPTAFLLASLSVSAQQDLFALTGKDVNTISFKDFRALDLKKGISGAEIFSVNSDAKVYSVARKGMVTEEKTSFNNSQTPNMATLAYNSFDNTLVYMPMFSSNIYILNPDTKEMKLVENSVVLNKSCDINSHITRMTTGYDGNIYAINNAGTQFIKIANKNGNYIVSDLGIIKDDASNGKNSFTEMLSGFGGDMVADSDNNFYVFAASGNVFKVSANDLTAKFLGKIQGLPDGYFVNGSAVNADNKVVIATAKGLSLFEVNMETLQANALNNDIKLPIYDLASKYFLNEKINATVLAGADIYPTKVTEQYFNVSIKNKALKGNLRVDVFDMGGKKVYSQNISSKSGVVEDRVQMNGLIEGAYIVAVSDESGKNILNKKILVTR